MAVTPVDLFAFGDRAGPRLPRVGVDVMVDSLGMVVPQSQPFPLGASTFADPMKAPMRRHYHKLPQGTILPEGLEVIADGRDVDPNHRHRETHHTIYPTVSMPVDQFMEHWLDLPWEYAGTKK